MDYRVASPKAKVGRTLAEFLADHNIRWGELIAGLLIVVCSIGLVVSLWTTITQMHRVVPSLIFLAGNAAIFGAGLYTLFRWRLQDTSRATLLIAMLLVPLGILAGLSTGGIGTSSVSLSDPITVACIIGAGCVYVMLIWQSSRALVGRKDAIAMTLSVAGPAAMLPLVPAALRSWQHNAGFIAYAASASIAVAVAALTKHSRSRRGNATGRAALVIAVAVFSLAVLVVYLAFMLRESEQGWLSIAIAAMPGVVFLASGSGTCSYDHKRPKLALTGTVVRWSGLLLSAMMIVPAMRSAEWLWVWAATFSISAALSAYVHRSRTMMLTATLPVSLAMLLCSPTLASDIPWIEIPLWKRVLGGEPMLTALGVGVGLLVVWRLIKNSEFAKPFAIASICWLGFATFQAALLTICPVSLMGAVPPWVLSALLAASATALVIASLRVDPSRIAPWLSEFQFSSIVTVVIVAFWISVFKPLVLGEWFVGLERLTWDHTGVGSLWCDRSGNNESTKQACQWISKRFIRAVVCRLVDRDGVFGVGNPCR